MILIFSSLIEFNEKQENGQTIAIEYQFSPKENNGKNFSCPRQTISKQNFTKYGQKEITWDEFVVIMKPFILADKCQLNNIENAFKTLSKDGKIIDMNKLVTFLNIVARELNKAATDITNEDINKFVLQGDANGDGNIDQSEFIQMFAGGIGNIFIVSHK
jgi:Ca2+-binding EF-hand superfamily protein